MVKGSYVGSHRKTLRFSQRFESVARQQRYLNFHRPSLPSLHPRHRSAMAGTGFCGLVAKMVCMYKLSFSAFPHPVGSSWDVHVFH